MKQALYKILVSLGRALGLWVVAAMAWLVSTGYFLFKPARVRASLAFYGALFPERGRWRRLALTWRQFHDFSRVFVERIKLQGGGEVRYSSEGWDHIIQAEQAGTGAVLLMSHLGQWEVAARLFRRKASRLLLYLAARQKEQIERLQKSDVEQDGVRLVVATDDEQGAFNGLEGLTFLRQGGVVGLPGDRVATADARRVEVAFAGKTVSLPQAPYAMAMVARAPVIVFFALREPDGSQRIIASPPIFVMPANRQDRGDAIRRAAQAYADLLEQMVRSYPTQWYHFEPFFDHR